MVETPKEKFIQSEKFCHTIFYQNPITAVSTFIVNMQRMIENLTKEEIKKYFTCGGSEIRGPNLCNLDEKKNYGFGIYGFPIRNIYRNLAAPVLYGCERGEVNRCVFVFKVEDYDENSMKKVSTLCSDFGGSIKSRLISKAPNNELVIFHGQANELESLFEFVSNGMIAITSFPEFKAYAFQIRGHIKKIKTFLEYKKGIDKQVIALNNSITKKLTKLDYSLVWSPKHPQLLQNIIKVCRKVIVEIDQNADEDSLKEIEKQVNQYVGLYQEKTRVEKETVILIERARNDFDKLMSIVIKHKDLVEFEEIKNLILVKSKLSGLELILKDIKNNVTGEPKISIIQVFIFVKNSRAKLPFCKYIKFDHPEVCNNPDPITYESVRL